MSRSAEHAIILRHCLQAVISQVFVGALHCCCVVDEAEGGMNESRLEAEI